MSSYSAMDYLLLGVLVESLIIFLNFVLHSESRSLCTGLCILHLDEDLYLA